MMVELTICGLQAVLNYCTSPKIFLVLFICAYICIVFLFRYEGYRVRIIFTLDVLMSG